jgi:ABC-2 type transport system permease protein
MRSANLSAFLGAARAEFSQLLKSPLLIILTVIESITFIFLVNFFGTTGAFAPTALINKDKGEYGEIFVETLRNAHHSFDLKFMDEESAKEGVKDGNLVAIVTIPENFTSAIKKGNTVAVDVVVNNIDTDMTADIQRAMPAAITKFGQKLQLPGIHVETKEIDLIDHDTGFVPYLVVSALALSAFIVSGILSAITVAREFETGTIKIISVSPVHPLIPLFGRVLATSAISIVTMIIAACIVIFGHHVIPVHPIQMALTLILCVIIFGCIGASIGIALKRSLPVASLIFGIALPLYLFSGAYEPERFDGNILWGSTHFFPLYYAIGILEHAVLDLKVTPESIFVNFLALIGFVVLAVILSITYIKKRISE